MVLKDSHPFSYWVRRGEHELRRNRKYFFPFSRRAHSPHNESDTLPLCLQGGQSQDTQEVASCTDGKDVQL